MLALHWKFAKQVWFDFLTICVDHNSIFKTVTNLNHLCKQKSRWLRWRSSNQRSFSTVLTAWSQTNQVNQLVVPSMMYIRYKDHALFSFIEVIVWINFFFCIPALAIVTHHPHFIETIPILCSWNCSVPFWWLHRNLSWVIETSATSTREWTVCNCKLRWSKEVRHLSEANWGNGRPLPCRSL